MERKNGPWKIKESVREYKNQFVEVVEDKVIQPDGEDGTYTTVKLKPGTCVLAVDTDGFAYLTRQFRYALGEDSIEVICGSVKEGESPLEAAKREAQEEAGITAEDWVGLGRLDIDTSIVNCRANLFLARGLKLKEPDPEGVETLTRFRTQMSEAVRMVMDGRITHAPSCVLILKAWNLLAAHVSTGE